MPCPIAPRPPIGAIGISVYAAVAIWYAVVARSYYDFAEPTVASIAWLFDRGLPIYHAIDAAERYSHIYGPLAFMIPGWFLAAVGPSILTSKSSASSRVCSASSLCTPRCEPRRRRAARWH